MLTIPNFISFLRLPLGLLFLTHDIYVRTVVVILALLSDGLDGFIARRYRQTSLFGTLLDPIMDRFFVVFAISILFYENKITYGESLTLFARDFSVMLYGFYLMIRGRLSRLHFRAIWIGKATTFLQFLVILALIFHVQIPNFIYILFVVLGFLALAELYLTSNHSRSHTKVL
ncbi:MAG: CDP-alcohol phosphatidyltransferase family protein [Waddliaceae bacterium]